MARCIRWRRWRPGTVRAAGRTMRSRTAGTASRRIRRRVRGRRGAGRSRWRRGFDEHRGAPDGRRRLNASSDASMAAARASVTLRLSARPDRREHDRQRPAVATRSPLDEAGVDQAVDEAHGARVGESRGLGEILRRPPGKELARATRAAVRRRSAGRRFGGVADPVGQRHVERAEDVDQVDRVTRTRVERRAGCRIVARWRGSMSESYV